MEDYKSLTKENKYFTENFTRLFRQYKNKYIIIKNQEVQGSYKNMDDAMRSAISRFNLGTFIIKKCEPKENIKEHHFYSRVVM